MTASESFLDGKVTLHAGDCLDVMPQLEANSIDACVCDPPYGLGFMGKSWDHGVPGVPYWKAVYRLLKPGAHLVAFGGTRTFGRMHVAIEDAGFEIRDMISWLYGSGFPKSLDVSKAIDKAAGAERKQVGTKKITGRNGDAFGYGPGQHQTRFAAGDIAVTLPSTEAAAKWSGFGTALKPACEPIALARKPLIGTVAENVLRHGTGALNIDGCRVATNGEKPQGSGDRTGGNIYAQDEWTRTKMANGGNVTPTKGRWPANVVHDGSDEVVGAFPATETHAKTKAGYADTEASSWSIPIDSGRTYDSNSGSAARFFYQAKHDVRCELCSVNIALDHSRTGNTQTGVSAPLDAAASPRRENAASDHPSLNRASDAAISSKQCRPQSDDSVPSGAITWPLSKIVQNVSDAASLCVLCATGIAHALAEVRRSGNAVPVHFNPSIGSSREAILSRSLASYVQRRESTDTILTTTNLRELFGCVFHAIAENINSERSEASTGSGSKRLFYSSKADADDRLGSKHPTVKPLDLMQWLVRLVTPPGGSVLDPFAGTGTTGEAAWREGMRAILIEREPEYQDDIRRRMAHALAGPLERKNTIAKLRPSTQAKNTGDDLFTARAEP